MHVCVQWGVDDASDKIFNASITIMRGAEDACVCVSVLWVSALRYFQAETARQAP